jgi:CheY-like chemotaxis protein
MAMNWQSGCALITTTRPVVLAVTGYGQASDREPSHAAGFDHHLVKPVDMVNHAAILGAIGNQNP